MEILDLLMRLLHTLSAITLLGGWLFMLAAMTPAMRLLDATLAESIQQMALKRFIRLSHPAMTFLLVSGLFNFWRNLEAYKKASKLVHPLVGVKVLLALAMLFITFAQAFKVLKGPPVKWVRLQAAMGLTVVALAVVVRHLRLDAMIVAP
jgi:uncharacterized membrane protein